MTRAMTTSRSTSLIFNAPIYLASLAALLTWLLVAFLLRHGILLTPDGWAYWEGAVSLLHGEGYTYFGGEPLTDWGVLFSLYLSGVQLLLGVHGHALRLSVIALAGLTSGAWVYLVATLAKPRAGWPVTLLYLLYAATFISLAYRFLLAETLFLWLLALLLLGLHQLDRRVSAGQAFWLPFLGVNLLLFLLLLTRNPALALLPGLLWALYLSLRPLPRRQRLLLTLLTGLLTSAAWLGVRILLEQTGSHPITIGGRFTPLAYGWQLLSGLASLWGPPTFRLSWLALGSLGGATLLVAAGLVRGAYKPLAAAQMRLLVDFTVLLSGAGGLYLLFNFTVVHDELNDRFLWFLALGLVGLLGAWLSWLPPSRERHLLLAVLALVTACQLLRAGYTWLVAQPNPGVVTPTMTIAPDTISGPPVRKGAYTLVAPPAYEWIDRRYRVHAGEQRP